MGRWGGPARRQRNVLRFWDGSTRDNEKSLKLSLGDFLEGRHRCHHAHSTPKPGHIALPPRRADGGWGRWMSGLRQ